MNGIFLNLEDDQFFVDFISRYYSNSQPIISDWFTCQNVIDDERVKYSHNEYCQNIGKFSVLLHSKNPDQYKRAGALLHALYSSDILSSVQLVKGKYGSPEDLESGFTMVSYGDAQHVLKFVDFYEEFFNQIHAFDLSYRCCATYEKNPRKYDFDYLRNVCRYLKAENNLSVDSCFMLFKSLLV